MSTYRGHELTDLLPSLSDVAGADDVNVSTQHAITGEPDDPAVGELWSDVSGSGRLRIRNADDDGWDDVAPIGRNVQLVRRATGSWALRQTVRLNFSPAVVSVTFEHLYDPETGERDTKTVTFYRDSTALGPRAEVQSSDASLGNTTRAVIDDPSDRRFSLRCDFRSDSFSIWISGYPGVIYFLTPGRYTAIGSKT